MNIAHDCTRPIDTDWSNERIATARGCELLTVTVQDKGGAGFYLMIFDAGNDVPTTDNLVYVQYVQPNGFASVNFAHALAGTTYGRTMRHGIYLAASSDAHTKTLLTSNDAFFTTAYKV